MNNDLLINMYKLLKYFIKQNEEDLVTYNNMVENEDSYEERLEFCNNMKPTVDNFYALKPYYIKYKENPTEELEAEITEKFGILLDEFKSKGKIENPSSKGSKSKEMLEDLANRTAGNDEADKPEKQPFPGLDDSSGSDFSNKLSETADKNNKKANKKLEEIRSEAEEAERAEAGKEGKKPFPSISEDKPNTKKLFEELENNLAAHESDKEEAPAEEETPAEKSPLEDTSALGFGKFGSKKPRVKGFFNKLSTFGKDVIDGIKEGFTSIKEEAAERKRAANACYFPESELESSGALALGKKR